MIKSLFTKIGPREGKDRRVGTLYGEIIKELRKKKPSEF